MDRDPQESQYSEKLPGGIILFNDGPPRARKAIAALINLTAGVKMKEPTMMPRYAFKLAAKRLVQQTGCKPTHAHEALAKALGYSCHNAYLAKLKELKQ